MKVWLQACRVNSLLISSVGVTVGSAVALHDGRFNVLRFVLAWLGSVLIQAGTNMTNVFYNYKALAADPAFDPRGSSAVIRMGLLRPEQVQRGGLLAFAGGILCGLLLTWLCGWPILWLGVPAVAAGYFYAGPPIRYGYIALGVVSVFIFMGPVMVGGAYYVMTQHITMAALAAAIPIGLVAAGIMHTNDLRDYAADVVHGKKTLATLLGRRGAGYALGFMDAAAFAFIVPAAAVRVLPWPVLLVLLAVPQAISQVRSALRETDPKQLHQVWLRGVKLHMQFGLLLIAGLLVATAFGI
ncbi:MAG TPA: 1,4-dihydroxy-2-naphthoate octaprenyltransferase [Bryobacteraceae bacterium]|nr:1,4-dihydroxy-2-naphthoate octaprenyltransferase [Bryobacteraceae bacterium]